MKGTSFLWNCILCLVLQNVLWAQPVSPTSKSLGEVPNADGTVQMKIGYQSSLDPSGWGMDTDRNSTPIFSHDESVSRSEKNAPLGNEHWDDQFGSAGLNATVYASAASGSYLYVGGAFTKAGSINANHIARWDGTSWSLLGSGLNGHVYAIAVSGSDVYAGGNFTTAGGSSANYIARWNGSAWSALGSGLNNSVSAIAVSGSDVYVGGNFTTAGGASANYIAKWNGSAWSALGSGLNHDVKDIVINGTDLYAGGIFTKAGGITAYHIARWGGSSWSSVGSGIYEEIYAVAHDGSNLYASGRSYYGIDVHKWNGTTWSTPDDTFLDPYREVWVNDIAVIGGDIYIGGWFSTPNGTGSVTIWYETQWNRHYLDLGIEGEAHTISAFDGKIFVGGWFEAAGNIGARYLAKYSDSQWSSLGEQNAPAGDVYALAFDGSYVYAAYGRFDHIYGFWESNISIWNGTTWDLPYKNSQWEEGTSGRINAMAICGDYIYVGGNFSFTDYSYPEHDDYDYFHVWNLGRWDRSTRIWYSLEGGGTNGQVNSIVVNGTDVYVGGDFFGDYSVDGISANCVAMWNGSSWFALGSGLSASYHPSVKSMAMNGTDLIVGGKFTTAGGVSVQNIARWDGTGWHDMNSGPGTDANDIVTAVAANDNHVFAACENSGNICSWDGSIWSVIGQVTGGYMVEFGAEPEEETYHSPRVYDMAMDGDNLVVGGVFRQVNGKTVNGIAYWNGTAWSSLGSGLSGGSFDEYYPPYCYEVMVTSNFIYAGGDFLRAGNKSSFHIGRYSKAGLTTPVTTLLSHFTKVTSGSVVKDGGASMGCAWGDYNNDQYPDLFVANDDGENNFLYENNGNGTFTKITTGAVVTDGGRSFAGTWGDYDNDGDLDLFVANVGKNFLYTNNGDGTFAKVTTGYPATHSKSSMGCAWCDFTGDGHLDLFVANGDGDNNFLYINNGDGTFNNVTTGDIVTDGGNSVTPAWGDYDNDGDMDLFVANKGGDNNFLYQNNGDGTFTKITSGAIVTDGGESWSASWGDYDNDGDMDLFVGNNNEANFLYRNNGNGTFTKITSGPLVTDVYHTRSSGWADCDNDGDLDLFTTNKEEKSILYANTGYGTFNINEFETTDARGMAWADMDRDGDLDLFIANNGTNNKFYKYTKASSNHWLQLKCVGTTSNASGIGAKIKIQTTIDGNPETLRRDICSQSGFGGQHQLEAAFGLLDCSMVESIRIEWPSGTVWDTTNVTSDQCLVIRERTTSVSETADRIPNQFLLLQNYPNPFNPETTIRYQIPEASAVSIKIFNPLGQEIITLLDERKPAGYYTVTWNGCDKHGKPVPSGIYLCQIRTKKGTQSRKMLLMR